MYALPEINGEEGLAEQAASWEVYFEQKACGESLSQN
jgi:hypothetical protein